MVHPENADYCGDGSGISDDYWLGAHKACSDAGMTLITHDALLEYLDTLSHDDFVSMITYDNGNNFSADFWAAESEPWSLEYASALYYRGTKNGINSSFYDNQVHDMGCSYRDENLVAICVK